GFHQHAAGRLAHVVGVRLEGQSPYGDGAATQVAFEMPRQQVEQLALLVAVHRFHRTQQACLVAVRVRRVFQRLHVLGKTRTAVTGAGIDEVVADARVRADAMAHHLDVSAYAFGDVGDFVHEADLGRQ